MNFFTLIFLALTAVVANSAKIPIRAQYPSTSGLKFTIDGNATYFAGTNSYWISFLTNDADVDLVMSHLNTANLKVLRVWGFNDINKATSEVWYQSLIPGQQPKINTGANGLQRLDAVVRAAEKHGIKLIIPFVNNWSDYGGIPAYNTYFNTTSTTWFTNTAAQAQYRKYIKAVVSRYKTSEAIFAWELGNEPRCQGCVTSVITNWAKGVSAYIKSLDSRHMVTLGDEGWLNGGGDGTYPYTTWEGVDFEAVLKLPNIDFGTFHLYPISWGITTDHAAWGKAWFANHGDICAKVGKPCLAEEFGATTNKTGILPIWQRQALDHPAIGGDMYWQYGDKLSYGNTHDDGYTIYYGSDVFKTLMLGHAADIQSAGSN
ncbi:(Trans)glycosidase [Glarea lozoyensis ATCC 20868]|uniref:mannan endo-1,4-beta-mannosidase n=1 Tax=Glarea lozoyensis (strain ATCC 20868 / MF5171) TaxID=1116229 RepID=S3CMY3_GLAL2|nr:(Trans)glycosidase [Glarea lozoyensis ATCC 20868]EPE27817.1 (Trans)glycosidase [Glarea lozoyensis ATCC 20868]